MGAAVLDSAAEGRGNWRTSPRFPGHCPGREGEGPVSADPVRTFRCVALAFYNRIGPKGEYEDRGVIPGPLPKPRIDRRVYLCGQAVVRYPPHGKSEANQGKCDIPDSPSNSR